MMPVSMVLSLNSVDCSSYCPHNDNLQVPASPKETARH